MRKVFVLTAIVVMLCWAIAAQAVVVDFESLYVTGTPYPIFAIPASYCGVTFSSNWSALSVNSDPYRARSGRMSAALMTNSTYGNFTFDTPVAFDGAWFNGYSFVSVGFQMYDAQSNLVWTSALSGPLSATPVFVTTGYSGPVKRVDLYSASGNLPYMTMDDLTYHSVPIPEASSLVALSSAMGLCLVVFRRRNRQ